MRKNYRAFICEQLGIEHHVEFGNVHRFRKRSNGRPRPMVARFLYHKDLRLVLDSAKRLNYTLVGIHGLFPNAIEEGLKKLYPIQKESKKQGIHVVLVRDQLFIDGMIYCHESKRQGKHVVLVRDKLFIDGMINCHESKKQGKHVVLVRDKLFIDGMIYSHDSKKQGKQCSVSKRYAIY